MFRKLKTKLTVAYGGLLGLILIAVAGAVYLSVQHTAKENVRAELKATASVYERLWQINQQQLAENADIMARDFGFREAVATQDAGTIASALDNLRNRLGLSRAFLVFEDGSGLEAGNSATFETPAIVMDAVKTNNHASGLIPISGIQYQAVAAPVMAPARVGWVIFATELDAAELHELESLSPISLKASIAAADSNGNFSIPDHPVHAISARTPLDGFGELPAGVLLLDYPMSAAMAPFKPMLFAIAALALAGLVALIVCSWFISKSLTLPITRLDRATRQLASGVPVDFEVESIDEIGRLAESFLKMAHEIETRERSIVKMSLTDSETLLPNRRALQQAIDQLKVRDDGDSEFCVAIGIDRLMHISTAIGQSATNELLAKFGARLERPDFIHSIGLVGADMIGVLITASDGGSVAKKVSDLLHAASEPILVAGEKIDITLSAGICQIGLHDMPGPVDEAIVALQQARTQRRQLQIFDAETYGDPGGTLSLMSDMVAGLSDGSVFLAYQPKYDCRQQAVRGVEALLRWNHPIRGSVTPDKFVEYAEETGHIRPLTQWVITQSASDRERMRLAGHDLKMSVNISGRLLGDPDFLDWAIKEIGQASDRFCFEVTETAVIDDPETALANIQRLRNAGVDISIDDYGSGLSSLSYLKQIPAQELKIDKSFVLGLQSGSSDALLIKSTIDLAHSLGMSVTAEGVETEDVLRLLRVMGADVVQGYYIGRPQTRDKTLDLLNSLSGETGLEAIGLAK